MNEPGKLMKADIDGLMDMIRAQASATPNVMQMALYVAPCPACQHEAALLLPKGFCCERCATIHDGERIRLKPTHTRKGPTWAYTLMVRNSIRDGNGQRIAVTPPPPITIGEMWRDLETL